MERNVEKQMQQLLDFEKKIEKFVNHLFDSYVYRKIRDRKVIHEAVHGSNIFYEHEIALIDSPLLQRLRRICQTGFTYLTYPTSIHTRFDHTLGVAVVVNHYIDAINDNLDDDQKKDLYIEKNPYQGDYANLRIAALLHDCGHSFYSHTSEKLYENHAIIEELKKDEKFAGCNPHEILSHYIVKSKPFKNWFYRYITDKVDLDIIADLIVGYQKNPEKFYLAEILNGPIDADKLDYIKRDGFFSGLKLTVDTERLFTTIKIRKTKNDPKNHIVLKSFIPIEQLVSSKRILYSTVYQHQKVRTCEAMINSVMEFIKSKKLIKFPLDHPVDYLYYTDHDFISLLKDLNQPFIKDVLSGIVNRNLYMRAFSVCCSTVEEWSTSVPYEIVELCQSEYYRNKLRQDIWRIIPLKIKRKYSLSEYNIQISFPELPSREKDETLNGYVIDKAAGNLVVLSEFFPVNEWLNVYINYKYKGYIFCPTFPEVRDEVFKAAKEIFIKQKGINIIDKYCRNDINL